MVTMRMAPEPSPRDNIGKSSSRFRLLTLLASALVLWVACASSNAYEIEINKSRRLLIVRDKHEVLKVFHVALGRGGPGSKQQSGDKKTPVGTYQVMGFNNSSKFDYFIRLSYPNVKDAFYGLRNGIISRAEFDRIINAIRAGKLPPQNTALGGAIGIHGIGEENPKKLRIHDRLDWTEGCIALTNREVHELRAYMSFGTQVEIVE